MTVSLIRLTAFGLAARSNPVNLPFFPMESRGRKAYPRKSNDTAPSHGAFLVSAHTPNSGRRAVDRGG